MISSFRNRAAGLSTRRFRRERANGGAPPADLARQEKLDNELMRIGKREFMKQLDKKDKEEDAMVETSGPTLRMMSKGKRSTNTKKN